jgi:hypothetical protein
VQLPHSLLLLLLLRPLLLLLLLRPLLLLKLKRTPPAAAVAAQMFLTALAVEDR